MKTDRKFRMKMKPNYLYNLAWEACAKVYGSISYGGGSSKGLSREGHEAFDDFCAGFQAGFKAGRKARRK